MCVIVVIGLEVPILDLGLVLPTWFRPATTSADLLRFTFLLVQ
jgi:hypothetical protein